MSHPPMVMVDVNGRIFLTVDYHPPIFPLSNIPTQNCVDYRSVAVSLIRSLEVRSFEYVVSVLNNLSELTVTDLSFVE